MFCGKCNERIPVGEQMEHLGQVLCEDCYIISVEPPRTCDVTAVHAAKVARKLAGQQGTEGLTELQTTIYEYIKEQGKCKPSELARQFNLPQWQIDRQLTILRHCELTRGCRINGELFVTLMEPGFGNLHLE